MRSNDEILLQKPPLFIVNYLSEKRINVNQGGTSSGKTYSIIDMLFIIAISEPKQVITVVGQDIPNLKAGAYRDAKTIYGNSELYQQWFGKPNETNRIFTCQNGSIIEFKSYSDEQDARSGKRDYLFINEANGIPFNIFWHLEKRTRKRIYIDYNPSSRFWVHEELIGKPYVKLIISDHRHNPYLTQEEHDRIESIEDKELFRVYARGLTGKIQGLIYTKWEIVDSMPDVYKGRWIGIDFGFTNDPTAIIDVRLSNGELWLDELEYSTGMTNPDISKLLIDKGITSNVLIVADSAEPKSIAELRNLRHWVEPSIKGNDSIINGIDILKRYKLNITRNSKGLRKEVLSYKWAEDKNGNAMNKPVDRFNHGLDAVRYVAINKLGERKATKKPKVRTTSVM